MIMRIRYYGMDDVKNFRGKEREAIMWLNQEYERLVAEQEPTVLLQHGSGTWMIVPKNKNMQTHRSQVELEERRREVLDTAKNLVPCPF